MDLMSAQFYPNDLEGEKTATAKINIFAIFVLFAILLFSVSISSPLLCKYVLTSGAILI
jgi:hypothetical protein